MRAGLGTFLLFFKKKYNFRHCVAAEDAHSTGRRNPRACASLRVAQTPTKNHNSRRYLWGGGSPLYPLTSRLLSPRWRTGCSGDDAAATRRTQVCRTMMLLRLARTRLT